MIKYRVWLSEVLADLNPGTKSIYHPNAIVSLTTNKPLESFNVSKLHAWKRVDLKGLMKMTSSSHSFCTSDRTS